MGAPAYDIADLEFDDPSDPELAELLAAPPTSGGALEDHSDLLDPPANDNAIDESELAAPPEIVRQRQAEYEAEHPDEVDELRALGFDDPAANDNAAPSRVVHVTAEGGGPIQIEGTVPPPEPMSSLEVLARGASQGATARWGDEGAAALAEAAPDEGSSLDKLARRALGAFGADLPAVDEEAAAIPRSYAAGDRYSDMRDNIRRDNAQAQADSPLLYGASEALAAVPGAIATAPVAGGTLPARIAANMAAGAAYGGVSGAGGSEADDGVGVAADALQGAEIGGLAGGGITAAAGKLAPVAARAAGGLERLANRARAGASGAYGGELARLTERHGPQYAERLGADIERLGLHRRANPAAGMVVGGAGGAALGGAGGAAQSFLSGGDIGEGAKRGAIVGGSLGALAGRTATPAVYRQNAEGLRKQLGSEILQSIDDATAQGVSYPKADLLAGMRARLRQYPKSTPQHRAVREQIRGLMRDVSEQHGEHLTPKQLQALKKSYEAPETGGFKPEQNMPAGDAATARMYRGIARAPRKALGESIEEQALPETRTQFANARRDYPVARQVENMARKREAQELGNQPLSLPAAATGDPIGALSVEGMKRVGRGGLADLARFGQNKARGLATAADAISGQRAVSSGAAVPVGQATGIAAGASVPGRVAPAMASDQQRSEAMGNANGYRLEQAVRDAMAQNPQALGPYSQRVQQAMQDSDPEALETLLIQLSQDETFRTQYAPALTGARQ